MKKCTNCGMVNEDYANFCNYCGKSFDSNNHDTYQDNDNIDFDSDFNHSTTSFNHHEYSQEEVNKIIIVGYILSIILSWGWIPLVLLKSFMNIGFIGFFGFFLPFYMINSPNSKVRRHGYVQLIICIIGFALGIYIMFH